MEEEPRVTHEVTEAQKAVRFLAGIAAVVLFAVAGVRMLSIEGGESAIFSEFFHALGLFSFGMAAVALGAALRQ
jgi:uncharacterized membrane protein